MRLAGKVAIISGGSRGMGAFEAELFVNEGAKVVVGDVREDEGRVLAEKIGRDAVFVRLDVTSEEDWAAAVKEAVDRYGKLDILVNNAGVSARSSIEETTGADWDRVMDINAKGVFLGTKAAIPEMRKTGGGSIINISSVDGIRAGMSHSITYAASKGGVIAMTRAMAVHHGRDNIRVNCIAPGMIYTSMVEAVNEKRRELRRQIAPLGTEGTAEDVALAAVFLASDESRWITGVLLPVDAGLMAAGPQSILSNIIGDDGTLLE